MTNITNPSKTIAISPYHLEPLPPLIPGFADGYLLIALPIVTYWVWGGLWYWIEHKNYFPRYRIHTSAEVLKRNRVPMGTILRNVATQQIITTVLGVYLTGEPDEYGSEEYDQARWLLRFRSFRAAIPRLLALLGIDAVTLAGSLENASPGVAAFLAGGLGDSTISSQRTGSVEFVTTEWELLIAWLLYWYLVPAFQFAAAIFLADSWQYFVHRTLHLNSWLYSLFSPSSSSTPPRNS